MLKKYVCGAVFTWIPALTVAVALSGCGPLLRPVHIPVTRSWAIGFDYGSGKMSAFQWQSSTFNWSVTPQGIVTGHPNASYPAIAPDGRHFFVPEEDGAALFAGFTFDPSNGQITEMPGSPYNAPGANPNHIVVHPSGQYIYMQGGGNIQGYRLDSSISVPQATGAPIAVPGGVFQLAMDPLGRFVYATCYSTAKIYVLKIDPNSGALVLAQSVAAFSGGIHGVAAHRSGNYLVVSGRTANQLGVYSIDATSGALTLVGPLYTGAGFWLAFDPSGKFLVNALHGVGLAAYTFDPSTGALAAVPNSPLSLGGASISFANFSPDGKTILTGEFSPNVHLLTLDPATNALSEVAGSPLVAPQSIFEIPIFNATY